jgi:hypothetical protein
MKMKTNSGSLSFLIAGLFIAALPSLPAGEESKGSDRVDVVFFEPEQFTDVREHNMDSDKARDYILHQLKSYLQDRARVYVPEGGKLTVTITDVDLAGEFEPWRGSAAMDVRIVKDIYPPRIKLSYRLTDANGGVIKQGERSLTNMDFLQNALALSTSDPLRHEKALLDDWLRSDFQRNKKS